jgi:hypothetical protein
MNKTETTCDVCAKSKPRSNRWCKECIALHCLANSLWRVRYDESDLIANKEVQNGIKRDAVLSAPQI